MCASLQMLSLKKTMKFVKSIGIILVSILFAVAAYTRLTEQFDLLQVISAAIEITAALFILSLARNDVKDSTFLTVLLAHTLLSPAYEPVKVALGFGT